MQLCHYFNSNPVFKYYFYLKEYNLLFSHAGFSKKLILKTENFEAKHEKIITFIESCVPFPDSPLYYIGKAHGGHKSAGGVLWCDWKTEFESIKGIRQIVCHSENEVKKKTGISINDCGDINIGELENSFDYYEVLVWDTLFNTFEIENVSKKYVSTFTR
jgi:hypothetical protein